MNKGGGTTYSRRSGTPPSPERTVLTAGMGWVGGAFLALVLLLVMDGGKPACAADNNLRFDGTLVADPCTLDPDTTNITLDFGTVIDKYLYLNTRTHSQPFTIRLLECDLSLGKTVKLTFSGPEDRELPGLLALTGGTARGVGIGMELADGTPLPFNKATPAFALTQGTTTLTLKGYVQGEPTAIRERDIVRGDFSATATFTLEYD